MCDRDTTQQIPEYSTELNFLQQFSETYIDPGCDASQPPPPDLFLLQHPSIYYELGIN